MNIMRTEPLIEVAGGWIAYDHSTISILATHGGEGFTYEDTVVAY